MAKAHRCIGGPLDGEYATTGDFEGSYAKVTGTNRNDYSKPIEGMYEHLEREYVQYNYGSGPVRNAPKMVWIHSSLLTPSISPRNR